MRIILALVFMGLGIACFVDGAKLIGLLIKGNFIQNNSLFLARINLRMALGTGLIYGGICFLNQTNT